MGLMTTIEDMGGAVAAIERGFQTAEIERLKATAEGTEPAVPAARGAAGGGHPRRGR
jgi:hypothetical protein